MEKCVENVTKLLQCRRGLRDTQESRHGLRNTQEIKTSTYEGDKQETTPENKLKVAN